MIVVSCTVLPMSLALQQRSISARPNNSALNPNSTELQALLDSSFHRTHLGISYPSFSIVEACDAAIFFLTGLCHSNAMRILWGPARVSGRSVPPVAHCYTQELEHPTHVRTAKMLLKAPYYHPYHHNCHRNDTKSCSSCSRSVDNKFFGAKAAAVAFSTNGASPVAPFHSE